MHIVFWLFFARLLSDCCQTTAFPHKRTDGFALSVRFAFRARLILFVLSLLRSPRAVCAAASSAKSRWAQCCAAGGRGAAAPDSFALPPSI